jgi:hypothetical protein
MGQVALGFRSLFIRLAIFVVMAALLAWTLGGTLFPRAEIADGPAVRWNDATWRLRLSLGGERRGLLRWSLLRQEGERDAEEWPLAGFERWVEASGPVALDDRLYIAFRDHSASSWTLAAITATGFDTVALPDRLEAERQLARLRNGLPPQSPADAAAARDAVLMAPSERKAGEDAGGHSEASPAPQSAPKSAPKSDPRTDTRSDPRSETTSGGALHAEH